MNAVGEKGLAGPDILQGIMLSDWNNYQATACCAILQLQSKSSPYQANLPLIAPKSNRPYCPKSVHNNYWQAAEVWRDTTSTTREIQPIQTRSACSLHTGSLVLQVPNLAVPTAATV